MKGQAIEQACILAAATSNDVVIVIDETPLPTPAARVPVEVFYVGNELSKKTSSSDSSCYSAPEEAERWSSFQKIAGVFLFCGILLCIILATHSLHQVFPTETFVPVLSGAYVAVFIPIFLLTVFVKKNRKDALVNIEEMLDQIERCEF